MLVGFQNEEVYRRFNKRYFYFKYEGGLKSHMTFGQIQVIVFKSTQVILKTPLNALRQRPDISRRLNCLPRV